MAAARTLVVDVGNSTVFAGLYSGGRSLRRFRLTAAEARQPASWTRRTAGPVRRAVLCSVVPALTLAVARAIERSLAIKPGVLTSSSSHGLKIGYHRPAELGADRIACALGARTLFPRRNVIVVDCGTATTVTALHRNGTILGGAILPGLGLWAEMLATRTAQLPRVSPTRPRQALGRSPEEALRSGFFFGHAGAIRELIHRVRTEAFGRAQVVVIGTGGNSAGLARENLFTVHAPDLILTGLHTFAGQISVHA